jgi:hypothetical protein
MLTVDMSMMTGGVTVTEEMQAMIPLCSMAKRIVESVEMEWKPATWIGSTSSVNPGYWMWEWSLEGRRTRLMIVDRNGPEGVLVYMIDGRDPMTYFPRPGQVIENWFPTLWSIACGKVIP